MMAAHGPGPYFPVERIVATRNRKGRVEYLVLWKGFSKEESSWVRDRDITAAAKRSFLHSNPQPDIIMDSVSKFLWGLSASLKSGALRKRKFTIEFRMDVFRMLFKNNGVKPTRGHGKLYLKHDFDPTYFSANWDVAYDRLGDGYFVDFPIRLCSKLKWSPIVYTKDKDGTLVCKPRTFMEVLLVHVVKERC